MTVADRRRRSARLVRRGVEADLLCGMAEERRRVGVEAERAEEVRHRVGRRARSDPGDELPRLVVALRKDERLDGDREDVNVSVRSSRRLHGPLGGLGDLPEADVGERAAREHRELQRIERREPAIASIAERGSPVWLRTNPSV